jgi:hypothetical protein
MNIEEVCDMNKIKMICLIVSFVAISSALFSCADPHNSAQESAADSEELIPFNEYDVENIDQVVASAIKRDYYQQYQKLTGYNPAEIPITVYELSIQSYLGNYSGCEIIKMNDGREYTDAIRPVEIAGYVIQFGSSQIIWAYKDHNFYTLKEAYDARLITKDDVYAISAKIGFYQEKN